MNKTFAVVNIKNFIRLTWAQEKKLISAPAVNRTRGPSMATMDFTTKPLALFLFGSGKRFQIDKYILQCFIHNCFFKIVSGVNAAGLALSLDFVALDLFHGFHFDLD